MGGVVRKGLGDGRCSEGGRGSIPKGMPVAVMRMNSARPMSIY